ncbi:hypothetical protein HPB50_017255 [Hyalomma asiaticum]|uniref:Uncharacterized protein n=1 Tax=Hyalomma asiaticum TaxID=266040 RepID=A0ACB7SHU4_HYAAI|nr:hypothetical protein HPB50_017255 [Hyalomma asiaticum]
MNGGKLKNVPMATTRSIQSEGVHRTDASTLTRSAFLRPDFLYTLRDIGTHPSFVLHMQAL